MVGPSLTCDIFGRPGSTASSAQRLIRACTAALCDPSTTPIPKSDGSRPPTPGLMPMHTDTYMQHAYVRSVRIVQKEVGVEIFL